MIHISQNLTSTWLGVLGMLGVSESLPLTKHVSPGAGMSWEQVGEFRAQTNNIRFQSLPSSHRRKVKHRFLLPFASKT